MLQYTVCAAAAAAAAAMQCMPCCTHWLTPSCRVCMDLSVNVMVLSVFSIQLHITSIRRAKLAIMYLSQFLMNLSLSLSLVCQSVWMLCLVFACLIQCTRKELINVLLSSNLACNFSFHDCYQTSRPGQSTEEYAHQVLDRFEQWGGNFIDTANVYATGKSEQFIGSWLQAR